MEPTSLQRALERAPQKSLAETARLEQEFFCFRIGELRLAVASENVREVIRAGALTPLPRTPAFVMGVCGYRGEVIPVLDLLRFLGKGEARIGPRTRLFVGTSQALVVAVLADQVIGLKRVPIQDLLPPPLSSDAASEHLTGVVTGKDKQDTLNVVAFSKILQAVRQRTVAR